MHHRVGRRAVTLLIPVALALSLAGCAPASSSSSSDNNVLTVWSEETQSDRVVTQQKIADQFTKETGIKVKIVAVDETQLPSLVQAAVLSGTLPDVMGAMPMAQIRELDSLQLLDTAANGQILADLGPSTFTPGALKLTSDGDRQLSIPSDGWTQLLVYRTDLFQAAGLAPPTDYDSILAAAKALTKDGQYGISLATDPNDVFTTQSFEYLALANGCQLVDSSGQIRLDSPQCRQAWDTYGQLATKYSPKGTQTVDTTRASYFTGQAAMVLWSSNILDELAGLRDDALPSCPQCEHDPTWLAKHSGIVTSISGEPGTEPSTYGEITSWTVLDGAKTKEAEQFVEYMMSDGYLQWLGMAPEGKVPMRTGDASDPQKYSDAWTKLDAGVSTKAPLSDFYSPATMSSLQQIGNTIDSWAIPQGQGDILGPIIAQLPISQAVADMGSGSISPPTAMKRATTDSKSIVKGLDR